MVDRVRRRQGVNFTNVFMHSFYTHKSHKRKKDRQLKQFFALSGSSRIKALHKHVDEIDPRTSTALAAIVATTAAAATLHCEREDVFEHVCITPCQSHAVICLRVSRPRIGSIK